MTAPTTPNTHAVARLTSTSTSPAATTGPAHQPLRSHSGIRSVIFLDVGAGFALLQAAATFLARHPPNCTLGGMIGNNSCGATAQRSGKVVDNIARPPFAHPGPGRSGCVVAREGPGPDAHRPTTRMSR